MQNITLDTLVRLKENGLNLNHLWILQQVKEGVKIDFPDTQALVRRMFIDGEEVTPAGEEFLLNIFAETSSEIEKITKDEIDEAFDKWWGTRGTDGVYPATDSFEYKGRSFKGSQKKNIKKDTTKKLFRNLVLTKEYTIEEILQGTENQVLSAKEQSYKTGRNHLSFIPNSERFLRELYFAPFINKKPKVNDRTAEEFSGTNY